jgi:uncharacterized protein YciI
MRFIAMLTHGPAWQPGRTVYQQGPPIQRHLEAMRRRFDQGELLLGGPFRQIDGGIAVLDVADAAAAQSLLDADPAVQAGVLEYEVIELIAYFDAYDGVRTDTDVIQLGEQATHTVPGVASHAS